MVSPNSVLEAGLPLSRRRGGARAVTGKPSLIACKTIIGTAEDSCTSKAEAVIYPEQNEGVLLHGPELRSGARTAGSARPFLTNGALCRKRSCEFNDHA